MNSTQQFNGNEFNCYFNDYLKRRNGSSMGLNGKRSTATAYNSVSATSNRNWNGTEISSKDNGGVIMRPKKLKDIQEKQQQRIRYRPLSSANSYASSLASSGMTDIRWRNSRASSCSSMSTSCQLIHDSPNLWKYEGYLEEEKAIISRGLESTKRLTAWYNERLKSIQKRANLLDRGLVPVDEAVHEEKLNYLRAHIAELNRRITSLVESSDHSFPTHSNLQVRTQMPQPNDDYSQYYRRQNIKLCQELAGKDRLIERLLNEKAAEKNIEHNSAFRKIQLKRLPLTTSTVRKYSGQSQSRIPPEGTLM